MYNLTIIVINGNCRLKFSFANEQAAVRALDAISAGSGWKYLEVSEDSPRIVISVGKP